MTGWQLIVPFTRHIFSYFLYFVCRTHKFAFNLLNCGAMRFSVVAHHQLHKCSMAISQSCCLLYCTCHFCSLLINQQPPPPFPPHAICHQPSLMPHPFIHNSMPFNIANDASFPHVSFVHPHHELDSRLPTASSMRRHTRSQWGTHTQHTARKKKNKYAFKFK